MPTINRCHRSQSFPKHFHGIVTTDKFVWGINGAPPQTNRFRNVPEGLRIMPFVIVLGNARYEAIHSMIHRLQSTLPVCQTGAGAGCADSGL